MGELADQFQSFDEKSDYDFAVQDSTDVHRELIAIGFTKKDELSYQDSQTEHILEGEIDGERVQVSLRRDLVKFKEAWRSIDVEFYWRFLNKRSPTFLGRDGVRMYLDQLFWLLNGTWRDRRQEKNLLRKEDAILWAVDQEARWIEVAV